jgi:hypothetical protein
MSERVPGTSARNVLAAARWSGGPLVAILIVYAVAAVWMIPDTRWQMNPDGISYILVARRLLAGDCQGAVNAHWSPLFSWMLVPLLASGVEALLACKLLTYLVGAGAIASMWFLLPIFSDRSETRALITIAFAASILRWASALITPDLLLLSILLLYLRLLLKSETPGLQTTIGAGLVGGLAYLAKSYGLPFFLVHFGVVHAIRWRHADACVKRRELERQFMAGIAAFFLIAMPWIATISIKYRHLTIGAAGPYSWRVSGPLVQGEHPVHTQGLLPPPDAGALSAWDDPSRLQFPPWPVSASSVAYLARLISHNAARVLGIIGSTSPLALPLLALAIYAVLRRRGTPDHRRAVAWALVTGAVFASGFLPLLLEERYLWILHALLLLITAAFLDDVVRSAAMSPSTARTIVVMVIVSFVVRPLLPRRPNLQGLVALRQAQDIASRRLSLRGRRMASDGRWEQTLYLDYYLGARYFGTPKPDANPLAIRRELDRNGIDVFIGWGARPPYLNGFRLVAKSRHSFSLYDREWPATVAQIDTEAIANRVDPSLASSSTMLFRQSSKPGTTRTVDAVGFARRDNVTSLRWINSRTLKRKY